MTGKKDDLGGVEAAASSVDGSHSNEDVTLAEILALSREEAFARTTAKQRALLLAEAIDAAALSTRERNPIGFNMSSVIGPARQSKGGDLTGHNCGTVGCIAGWMEELFGRDSGQVLPPYEEGHGGGLFMPFGWNAYPQEFPPKRAAAVLRDLAENGRVDWNRFDREGNPIGV